MEVLEDRHGRKYFGYYSDDYHDDIDNILDDMIEESSQCYSRTFVLPT